MHSPKRDHVAATRVTNDVDAFLRNHANGRAQGTNDGSASSTHCALLLLLQPTRDTKLLPVVQLRSGVILLMGISYIPVARVGEVAAGAMTEVDLGGRQVLVANVEGKYFAFSRQCPHEDADLKTGTLDGAKVRCNNHNRLFQMVRKCC